MENTIELELDLEQERFINYLKEVEIRNCKEADELLPLIEAERLKKSIKEQVAEHDTKLVSLQEELDAIFGD